jgi:hypothetical protein
MQGVAQHRQQIHSKLVNIMRERLATSLKALHATSASWGVHAGGPVAAAVGSPSRDAPAGAGGAAMQAGGVVAAAASPPRAPGNAGSAPRQRAISKMMLQISRQIVTLHEAVAPIMSRSQQAEIGMRVRRMYSEALARCAPAATAACMQRAACPQRAHRPLPCAEA